MTDGNFWSDMPLRAHGTPQNPHVYGTGPRPRDRRECQLCRQWRPPAAESLTVHPVDRRYLDDQIPTARVFGEPLPDGCLILENPNVTPGTIRLRIEGDDITVTLGEPPQPRWIRCDPLGETPFDTLR
jgi:hypothetical protein